MSCPLACDYIVMSCGVEHEEKPEKRLLFTPLG